MKWNNNGTVLAVSGTKVGIVETQIIQFFSPLGKHLRTLKIPGNNCAGLTFDGDSLRLAVAIDSHIYFANIRPEYKWGFFGNTLLYSFNKSERVENCVCFWDIKTDERHVKYVKKLVSIRAGGDMCVLATRSDDSSGQFILILCNSIGTPVDSKYIDIEPVYLTMNSEYIVAASNMV